MPTVNIPKGNKKKEAAIGRVMVAFAQTIQTIREDKPKALKSNKFKIAQEHLQDGLTDDFLGVAISTFDKLGKKWRQFALVLAKEAEEIITEMDEFDYEHIAKLHRRAGNYEQARDFALKGIAFYTQGKHGADDHNVSYLYYTAAKSEFELGNFKAARNYAVQAFVKDCEGQEEFGLRDGKTCLADGEKASKLIKKINKAEQSKTLPVPAR